MAGGGKVGVSVLYPYIVLPSPVPPLKLHTTLAAGGGVKDISFIHLVTHVVNKFLRQG